MVSFERPWALLLLPLAALAAWLWLRRPVPALRVPDLSAFDGLPASRTKRVLWTGVVLRGVGVTALVLALAGPRWPADGDRIGVEGVAVVMVLDVSGSMAEADFSWAGTPIPRLAAAKRAFRLFVTGGDEAGTTLPGRPADAIGLVAFALHPEDTCPLTLDHEALLRLLDAEEPRSVPDTGTNIGDAIALALTRLASAGDRRLVVILLSDGEHNVPVPALTPRQAAQLAANRGATIHAIDTGGLIPAGASPADAATRAAGRKALESVAAMTGGKCFTAHDAASLLDACATIDRLERRPIESFQYRRYRDAAPVCALAAFACLTVAAGLDLTRWRRVP